MNPPSVDRFMDMALDVAGRSAGCDVIIVGSSRAEALEQLSFRAIPEEVSRRVASTVLMAKRHLGPRSGMME